MIRPLTQKETAILEQARAYCKKEFSSDTSGHDFQHVLRVVGLTIKMLKHENADPFTTLLAAFLHDLDDPKLISNSISRVDEFLETIDIDDAIKAKVKNIVANVSFTRQMSGNIVDSIEGQIVQDADRLDAMGAIGIARCFAFGGHRNRQIYSGSIDDSSSLAHFYQKLVKLKDLMNTKTGKRIAKIRHKRLESYLSWFHQEWNESL
ncbi:MAG: HD domain-containing protein [Bacilli bacterium]|nr:HD domain-containing protein [Bacilli bacterium]MBN2696560.1 HD domain-containing protein [Bacilli bacterium]